MIVITAASSFRRDVPPAFPLSLAAVAADVPACARMPQIVSSERRYISWLFT